MRFKKKMSLIFLILFFSAQIMTGVINRISAPPGMPLYTGTVLDARTYPLPPLEGAKVELLGNDRVVSTDYTDSTGLYVIWFPASIFVTYKLRVSKSGFNTEVKTVTPYGGVNNFELEAYNPVDKYAIVIGHGFESAILMANEWADHFENIGYIVGKLISDEDPRPYETNIRSYITTAVGLMDFNDKFAIVIIGHGNGDSNGDYFETYDSNGKYYDDELIADLTGLQTYTCFIFLDFSESGGFLPELEYWVPTSYHHSLYAIASCADGGDSHATSTITCWSQSFLVETWVGTFGSSTSIPIETIYNEGREYYLENYHKWYWWNSGKPIRYDTFEYNWFYC